MSSVTTSIIWGVVLVTTLFWLPGHENKKNGNNFSFYYCNFQFGRLADFAPNFCHLPQDIASNDHGKWYHI